MIRINLLRDVAGGAAGDIAPSGSSESGAELNQVDTGIKVALFLIPLILVFGFRQIKINRAQARNAELQAQKNTVDSKLLSYQATLKDIERFEEEKRKVNSQLDVIKDLSKERLKTVKSLDAMQTIIPNSAWLNLLRVKGDKVELEGYAVNDVVVSEFMQSLGSSIYFSHIVLTDSVESTTPEGSVKKFKIKCNLEKI